MAFKKTLAQRLLSITKISPSQSLSNPRISSSSVQSRIPSAAGKRDIAPDPGDNGIFRRLFHKRAAFPTDLRSPPVADSLLRKLREMDISRSRIRLDGLAPPPETKSEEVTVDDARKLLRAAQMDMVKSKLQKIPQSCVTYSEFVRICEETFSDRDQAMKVAKMLDDSASVIVFGDVVFLRPEQEIESLLFGRSKT